MTTRESPPLPSPPEAEYLLPLYPTADKVSLLLFGKVDDWYLCMEPLPLSLASSAQEGILGSLLL